MSDLPNVVDAEGVSEVLNAAMYDVAKDAVRAAFDPAMVADHVRSGLPNVVDKAIKDIHSWDVERVVQEALKPHMMRFAQEYVQTHEPEIRARVEALTAKLIEQVYTDCVRRIVSDTATKTLEAIREATIAARAAAR